MAERKRTSGFTRPGGYRVPSGGVKAMRKAADDVASADIRLFGDRVKASPRGARCGEPSFHAANPDTRLFVGDCRDVLPALREQGQADLVFADPPFNWDVPYDGWHDGMPRDAYERFTFEWLDACIALLSRRGSLWVNIGDDTAAEVVLHMKRRGMHLMNWCIWHFRFGQHRRAGFIPSKCHALYFARDPIRRIWNPDPILEPADRAAVYQDRRTMAKKESRGLRVPMDVWYGPFWGRVHGRSRERRHAHHNQLPEAYLERVILACTRPGSLVVDPFCGSGTTATVARCHGRPSISVDVSQEAAASAWKRIAEGGMSRKGRALGRSHPIKNSKQI